MNFYTICAAAAVAGFYMLTVFYRAFKLVLKNSSGKKFKQTTTEDFGLIILYDFADAVLFSWKWLCKAWSFMKLKLNKIKNSQTTA